MTAPAKPSMIIRLRGMPYRDFAGSGEIISGGGCVDCAGGKDPSAVAADAAGSFVMVFSVLRCTAVAGPMPELIRFRSRHLARRARFLLRRQQVSGHRCLRVLHHPDRRDRRCALWTQPPADPALHDGERTTARNVGVPTQLPA